MRTLTVFIILPAPTTTPAIFFAAIFVVAMVVKFRRLFYYSRVYIRLQFDMKTLNKSWIWPAVRLVVDVEQSAMIVFTGR